MFLNRFRNLAKKVREKGFLAAIKSVGWKVTAGIFVYYIVRDVTLYVLVPYLVAKRIAMP